MRSLDAKVYFLEWMFFSAKHDSNMQTTKKYILYTPSPQSSSLYITNCITRTNLRVACAKQHGETLLILLSLSDHLSL